MHEALFNPKKELTHAIEKITFRSPFSVLRSPFSVLRSPFSVLRSPFSLLFLLLILRSNTFAGLPSQSDYYHNYFKIESKGFSGKVLTRSSGTGQWVSPSLNEHVSLSHSYSGAYYQRWLIAPTYPGSNEYFIINRATGYPLMVDGNTVKCNTSGEIHASSRFKFKNVNGDYCQIQSVYTVGCFYYKKHDVLGQGGLPTGNYYYSLYYSTDQSINNDYSYFKFTEVEGISGVSTSLTSQPSKEYNITPPPEPTTLNGANLEYRPNETIIGETLVPCCLVNDPNYSNRSTQVVSSPYYREVRKQSWEKRAGITYYPGWNTEDTYEKYKSITDAQKQTAQTTLQHSWSETGQAQFTYDKSPVKFTLGKSYEEKLNRTTTYSTTSEYTKSTWEKTTETVTFQADAGIFIADYELYEIYTLTSMDNHEILNSEIYYPQFNPNGYYPNTSHVSVTAYPTMHKIMVNADFAPETPQGFTAGSSNNHPYISWNANTESDLSHYEVWKKQDGTWSLKTTTTNTNYTDTDETMAAPDSYVYYKICAVDDADQKSDFTNELEFGVTSSFFKLNSSENVSSNIPLAFQLSQNYPNPFNPATTIKFGLPEADKVLLQVFNTNGQLIATLVDGNLEAGYHNAKFSARDLPSGIYLYKLTTSKNTSLKRMVFVK